MSHLAQWLTKGFSGHLKPPQLSLNQSTTASTPEILLEMLLHWKLEFSYTTLQQFLLAQTACEMHRSESNDASPFWILPWRYFGRSCWHDDDDDDDDDDGDDDDDDDGGGGGGGGGGDGGGDHEDDGDNVSHSIVGPESEFVRQKQIDPLFQCIHHTRWWLILIFSYAQMTCRLRISQSFNKPPHYATLKAPSHLVYWARN